ncbi:MAG: 50S ribosomal protein L25/general stress protein Ctc [Alphaproteobacteria bacterium]
MTKVASLQAEIRPNQGKGAARATRRSGQVPAVIYGDKQAPLSIMIDNTALVREVNRAGFFTHLYDIEVKGAKHRVLPRDVQFDPVTDRPLHVDFLRVAAHTRVRVAVPFHFINQDKAPGIKRGGMLNVVSHELELMVQPDNIPDRIDIDLAGLEIGISIHLGDLKLPVGVKAIITDKDFTLATIVPPTAVKTEAAEAAAAAAAPAAAAVPAAGAPAAAAAGGKAAAPAAAAPAAGGKAAPAAAKAPAKK